MIRGLKFVSIPVRNQDASLKFFTEKLGFKVATDQFFSEKQRWIELLIPGAETGLVLFTPAGHENRIAGDALRQLKEQRVAVEPEVVDPLRKPRGQPQNKRASRNPVHRRLEARPGNLQAHASIIVPRGAMRRRQFTRLMRGRHAQRNTTSRAKK